jgi:hypothetical protein
MYYPLSLKLQKIHKKHQCAIMLLNHYHNDRITIVMEDMLFYAMSTIINLPHWKLAQQQTLKLWNTRNNKH